jgi:hypothetical protein
MGVSCGAAIIVGLEVHHEDFWTERTITPSHVSCPEGHLQRGPNEKFCSQCGGKFGKHATKKLVCSPYLAAIAGDDDPHGRAGEIWNPERTGCLDEQARPSAIWKGLGLLCVDGNEDQMDGEPQNLALGFVLHEVVNIASSNSPAPLSSHPHQIAALADELRDVAAKLGIDREPKVYLHTGAG